MGKSNEIEKMKIENNFDNHFFFQFFFLFIICLSIDAGTLLKAIASKEVDGVPDKMSVLLVNQEAPASDMSAVEVKPRRRKKKRRKRRRRRRGNSRRV